MTVRNEDDSYRPLDRRTMEELARADTWRSGLHAMRQIEEDNRRRSESIDKDFSDEIRDISRDNYKYIKKDLDSVVGASNVPKSDLREALDRRRGRWLGPRDYNPRTKALNPTQSVVKA
jgi:hypothetical protein